MRRAVCIFDAVPLRESDVGFRFQKTVFSVVFFMNKHNAFLDILDKKRYVHSKLHNSAKKINRKLYKTKIFQSQDWGWESHNLGIG